MSCEPCKTAQQFESAVFYRWKNANIQVKGCEEHLKEIFLVLNDVQERIMESK